MVPADHRSCAYNLASYYFCPSTCRACAACSNRPPRGCPKAVRIKPVLGLGTAKEQLGAFLEEDVKKGELVFVLKTRLPKVGIDLPPDVKYSFEVSDGTLVWVVDCDANKANHSCNPNCEVKCKGILNNNGKLVGWWLGVYAKEDFAKGTEILYDYGKTSFVYLSPLAPIQYF